MALPLFVYGTLLDSDVRRLVIGRELAAPNMAAATLTDHAVHVLDGHSVPAAVPRPGARIAGRLLYGLTGEEHRRIAVFEGPAYDARRLTVSAPDTAQAPVEALVYLARPGLALGPEGWSLESWQSYRKPAFLREIAGDPEFDRKP